MKEEIKKALCDMAPFKSPGNNGLHAGFFHKSYEIVGNSLCEYVLNFLNTGNLLEGSNDTLLALIPKVNNLESLTQIQPISLYNVGYKTITKTVENQAYVASCLCMFLSIFRILFFFFNFPELMQFTVIITVIIIFDLESF